MLFRSFLVTVNVPLQVNRTLVLAKKVTDMDIGREWTSSKSGVNAFHHTLLAGVGLPASVHADLSNTTAILLTASAAPGDSFVMEVTPATLGQVRIDLEWRVDPARSQSIDQVSADAFSTFEFVGLRGEDGGAFAFAPDWLTLETSVSHNRVRVSGSSKAANTSFTFSAIRLRIMYPRGLPATGDSAVYTPTRTSGVRFVEFWQDASDAEFVAAERFGFLRFRD